MAAVPISGRIRGMSPAAGWSLEVLSCRGGTNIRQSDSRACTCCAPSRRCSGGQRRRRLHPDDREWLVAQLAERVTARVAEELMSCVVAELEAARAAQADAPSSNSLLTTDEGSRLVLASHGLGSTPTKPLAALYTRTARGGRRCGSDSPMWTPSLTGGARGPRASPWPFPLRAVRVVAMPNQGSCREACDEWREQPLRH